MSAEASTSAVSQQSATSTLKYADVGQAHLKTNTKSAVLT